MRPAIIGFKEGWSLMENGVTKLLNLLESRPEEPFNSNTHMKLYTTVYNMCVQQAPNDFSEALYNGYKGVFKNHCDGTVLPSLRERHGEFLLREFVDRWATHVTMIRWMRNFFSYLDRFYVSKRSVQPLKEAAVDCFRESVYEGIKVKVRDAVIRLIRQEREGEQIDRALLKNVLDVFIAMGKPSSDKALEYYQLDFEAPMLKDTVDYYSRKASVWIGHDTCPEYMFKAEECLRREKERASHYLHASSEVKLLSNAERQLLTVRSSQLLEKEHSGCRALLRDDKEDDLSRMYRLFVRVPDNGLNPVASIFKQHVMEEGLKLVDQAQEAAGDKKPGKIDASTSPEQVFVAKVIELHDKYLGYVRDCFLSHTLFHKALKEAFEVFCNKNIAGSSSAEVLSLFCDTIMKKGGSEEATEETFDKVVALLSYFGDKDLFAEFSRKKLARRLLFDRSANEEQERSLLMKLKHQYGAQFTSKMEGMVTDMMLAREVQTEFEECKTQKHHHQGGVDVIASVLTTGFWPTYKSSDLNLPAEMAKCVESFKEFYGAKTKQRKLTWIYSLGTCNVVGNFDTKKIELVVTTYQASLLVLFNESDRLCYSEIKEQLNLGDEDVVRLLHSLSCTKYKILSKEPKTKTVSPTDTFEFNSKFTDKMRRIKIPLPPVDDKKKVIQDVTKERRLTVDACIVRIMKSRKVLGHQELVLECAAQLTKLFRADNKIIKQRIEDLISRDFLERDLDNSNVYKYVA